MSVSHPDVLVGRVPDGEGADGARAEDDVLEDDPGHRGERPEGEEGGPRVLVRDGGGGGRVPAAPHVGRRVVHLQRDETWYGNSRCGMPASYLESGRHVVNGDDPAEDANGASDAVLHRQRGSPKSRKERMRL